MAGQRFPRSCIARHAMSRASLLFAGVLTLLYIVSPSGRSQEPGRCAMLLQEPITGASRKSKSSRAVLQYLSQGFGHEWCGNQYDTNAIGESFRGTAMRHWVDRAGADESADLLEGELMSMRIARRPGHDGRRLAMHQQRLERQSELNAQRVAARQQQEQSSGRRQVLASSSYDPSAVGEAFNVNHIGDEVSLESELDGIIVGRRSSLEGPRLAMRQRRAALRQV